MTFRTVLIAIAALTLSTGVLAKNGPKDQDTLVDVAIETRDALNSLGEDAPFTINTIVDVVAGDMALLNALTRRGQRTVFAPTDEAFGDLVALLGTLCLGLEDLSTDELRTVVSYHVANGRRDAEDVLASDQIRTINRGFLWQDMGVLTDSIGRDANIIATDVFADNGVIHVIDAVVLPFAPPSACE